MSVLRADDLLPLGVTRQQALALRNAVMRSHPGGGLCAGFCLCGGQGQAGPACEALAQLREAAQTVRELLDTPKATP